MLTILNRQVPETLSEIVKPEHTVVMVHDMQNDNTGKGGKSDKIGRRIDVTGIIPPIASFLRHARQLGARVMYTQYTNLPNFGTFTEPRLRDYRQLLNDPRERATRRDFRRRWHRSGGYAGARRPISRATTTERNGRRRD